METRIMKQNMGTADRIIRFVLIIAIAALYFNGMITGVTAIVLVALAAILLLTSLSGFCPAYYTFKITTCRKS
jgi:uncharacterized membrane protein